MKHNLLRKIIMCLTTAALALTAAGCASEASAESTVTAEAAASGDEPIELTFLHIHGGDAGAAIEELCEEYSQSTGGKVHVTPIYAEGSYEGILEKLQSMTLSNDLPNISQAGHHYVNFMTENIPVVYAQDFIDEDGTDVSDFFPKMLDLGRDEEGKLAGIPFATSTSILYINKDMFEANGLDPEKDAPKTFDEMREIAKKLTKDGNYGLFIDYEITGNWEIQTMIEDMGGQMLSDDRSEVAFEPQMEQVLDYLNILVNEDKSMPLMTSDQGVEAFKAGKVGMYITTTASLKEFQNGSDFEVTTALHPNDGSGAKGAPVGGNSLYVLKSTPEEEQASWDFVKFMTSEEATTKIAQRIGYMVTRQSALDSEEMQSYLAENPAAAVTYEQVDYVTPWCNFPGGQGTKYVKVVQDGILSVLNRQSTPAEAAQKMVDDCNAIISGR